MRALDLLLTFAGLLVGQTAGQLLGANLSIPFNLPIASSGPFDLYFVYPLYKTSSVLPTSEKAHPIGYNS